MMDLSMLPHNARGEIVITEHVNVHGDAMTITEDNFRVVFAAASALAHSDLSAAVGPGSGWHKHLDDWKARGIIS